VFFTNYLSRKGRQLEQNPNASLLFFWDKMERQVRIEGIVSKVPESESEHYFSERPLLSQIGALVSPQSSRIRNREELTEKISYYEAHPEEVKRPQHWGGYALKPEYFEFWQGRESRLHDRIAYEMTDRGWEIFRLAP
ncbi:MAG TPA: pyridoxamine 5'-phosphate oxidase, partial [Saprospiraceae bacterium]|nr:pyridoxamine 5'-phosphate oxidase [Saprospiraceae bacterium]